MNKVILVKTDNAPGIFPEYIFDCPGCGCDHGFKTTGVGPRWNFNGDVYKPTLSPSLLVRFRNVKGPQVCHSFITDGKIKFLNDCTHKLAGKTVDLEPFDG